MNFWAIQVSQKAQTATFWVAKPDVAGYPLTQGLWRAANAFLYQKTPKFVIVSRIGTKRVLWRHNQKTLSRLMNNLILVQITYGIEGANKKWNDVEDPRKTFISTMLHKKNRFAMDTKDLKSNVQEPEKVGNGAGRPKRDSCWAKACQNRNVETGGAAKAPIADDRPARTANDKKWRSRKKWEREADEMLQRELFGIAVSADGVILPCCLREAA